MLRSIHGYENARECREQEVMTGTSTTPVGKHTYDVFVGLVRTSLHSLLVHGRSWDANAAQRGIISVSAKFP